MDEKALGSAWPQPPPTRTEPARRHGSKWCFLLSQWRLLLVEALFVSLLPLGYFLASGFGTRERQIPLARPDTSSPNPMDPWSDITPSRDLVWHPCYTTFNPTFLCARLTLPMDYDRPLPTSPLDPPVPEVHIALLLLPAQTTSNRSAKPPKSPVVVNPGGPGGSGVTLTLLAASGLQQVLGYDQPVLGFDPRGVMFTTPNSDCWSKPPSKDCKPGKGKGKGKGDCGDGKDGVVAGLMHRLQWQQVAGAVGLVSEGGGAMRSLEVAQRGVNGLCAERDRGLDGESGLKWAGTEYVVRDLVEVVDKWDEWVEREGLPERELKGKLVFWGFSYGSYLGAAFARAFPERVGRLVLDGVVDAELYEDAVWAESLVDADKVLGEFYRYCAEAGKKCQLYRNGDKTEDVKRRFETAMESLRTDPITFTHPQYFYPAIFRHDLVKQLVFVALYSPIQGFPMTAWLVNYVYQRNHELLGSMFQDEQLLCSISADPMLMHMLTDAQRTIMCSDKAQPVNFTLAEWDSAYQSMASTSQFADIWTGLMMQCSGWDLTPPQQDPNNRWGSDKQIETANPLLFLSNTYDPVTPLRAAVKMAQKFKGAGLLEQNASGHCTLSAVSRCTAKVVREYLATGEVPSPPKGADDQCRGDWKRCDADEHPWGPSPGDTLAALSTEDRDMMEGWQQLREVMDGVKKFGVGEGKGLDREAIMAMANLK